MRLAFRAGHAAPSAPDRLHIAVRLLTIALCVVILAFAHGILGIVSVYGQAQVPRADGPATSGHSTAPIVSIQVGTERTDTGSDLTILVAAEGARGLRSISLTTDRTDDPGFVGGQPVECDGRERCSETWTTRPSGTGAYRLTARVVDLDDQVGEASVGLTVLPPLRTSARRPVPSTAAADAVRPDDPAQGRTGAPRPAYYRIDAPEEDAVYLPVTIAELLGAPETYDGRLVRVAGTFRRWTAPAKPGCSAPAAGSVEGSMSEGVTGTPAWWGLAVGTTTLGVYPWRLDDVLAVGSHDTNVSYQDGQSLELRGLARLVAPDPACQALDDAGLASGGVVLLVRRAELTFAEPTFDDDRIGPPPVPPRSR